MNFEDNAQPENVVAFPTGDYKPQFTSYDDPLEDLLSEFDHLDDKVEFNWEDLKEEEVGETTVEMVLGADFKKCQTPLEMLSQLNELQKRTQHYMNELETFLPKKNR